VLLAILASATFSARQALGNAQVDPTTAYQTHFLSMWSSLQALDNYDLEVVVRHITQRNSDPEKLELTRQYHVKKRADSVLSTQPGMRVLSTSMGFLVVDESRKRIVISRHHRPPSAAPSMTLEDLKHSISRLTANTDELPRYVGMFDGELAFEGLSSGEIVRTMLYMNAVTRLLSRIVFFHNADAGFTARSEIRYIWKPPSSTSDDLRVDYYIAEIPGLETVPTLRFIGYHVMPLE
jgi:hypothetical protein